MREIKFRAWNKRDKYMDEFNVFDANECMREDDYVLLQYTGLKDKNGKEIYEGDIVSGLSGINLHADKHLIEFKDGAFGVGGMGLSEGSNEYNWTIDNIEVIGNIYQNPELLK